MDKKTLIKAGLSKGETEVYLTLLRTGASLVSRIAQETGLLGDGFDTPPMVMMDPDRLLDFIREKEAEVEKMLPELKSLMAKESEGSSVEVFKGKEGLKSVLKDVLKENKDYVVLEEEGYIQEVLPHFFRAF